MPDTDKASPRPWKPEDEEVLADTKILGADGEPVTEPFFVYGNYARPVANLALIVRAVNAHAALVAFVERVKARLREVSNGTDLGMGEAADLWNAANDALKLAEV